MVVETGLPLDETAALDVVAMGDSSCALVLLHLAEKMKVDTSPLIARAEDVEAPLNGDWLLAYEAARHGWADPGPIGSHAEFRELASRDVGFFDPSARVGIDVSGEEY